MKHPEKCPICGIRLTKYTNLPHCASRDHILPKERGGNRSVLYGSVRNIRIICRHCNGMLAAAGHCPGALACVRDVAAQRHESEWMVMRRWRMGLLLSSARQSPVRKKKTRKTDFQNPATRGLCIFPADTAAKRVWNLAVLASRQPTVSA